MDLKLIIFGVALVFLVLPSVNAQSFIWEDPAGDGQGWVHVSNFTAIPATTQGENAGNDKWDNASDGGCAWSKCFKCNIATENCSAYMERDGFSEGFYDLILTGFGAAGDKRNVTLEVSDRFGVFTNTTVECASAAGGQYCNFTEFTVRAYVNDSGILSLMLHAITPFVNTANVKIISAFNITNYTAAGSFSLLRPENVTYYNNFSIYTMIKNSTNVVNMNYSLNGGANVSYTNRSLINATLGSNSLTVYASDGGSLILYDSVNFEVNFTCNSTYANTKVCGGRDGRYLLNCTNEKADTQYDWSTEDITFCQGACWNGECLNPEIKCSSYCDPNSGMKICGGQKSTFILECTDDDSDGCYDWSGTNTTFCTHGCRNGLCLNGTNQCIANTNRCSGSDIITCRDVNNDTFYEWDFANVTYCKHECFENITAGLRDAYCETGSGNFTIWYGLNSAFRDIGVYTDVIFFTPRLKSLFVFGFAFALAFIVAVFTKDWLITIGSFYMMILAGTFVGWVPLYITIIFTVLMGTFFYIRR